MWFNAYKGMLSFCEVIVLKNQYAIRESLSAEDIKVLRERMGLSQNEFSRFLSVSKRTVER